MRRLLLSVAGLVAVVLAVLGGSYWWLSCRFDDTKVTTTGVIGGSLANPVDPPDGMDILVLGCDKDPEMSRSDTVMLVHVDPDSDYLSILSLPRDLRVEIPGHDMGKLNWAYTFGGWELTAETVGILTNVQIDQYVEVDFQAFADIVSELGGVYVDVDRRYFNQDADASYEHINISPGYQLLDSTNALDYVRFRHDDNGDFGRMRRQQRFIAALREQAMGWNLALDLYGIVDAVCNNLTTTIETNDIFRLALWGVGLDGSQIRQVSLAGDIQRIDGELYVVASDDAVEKAVSELMTAPSATGVATTTASTNVATDTTSSTAIDRSVFTTNPDAVENSVHWHNLAGAVTWPVMAPGYLPTDYRFVDSRPSTRETPGAYDIQVDDDSFEEAIKFVYQREGTDQYMGVMETTWLKAPAAADGLEVEYNGITYTIVGTSQRTDHVWWIRDGVLYWVSNTLSYLLNSTELLKVAESMIVIPSGAAD